MPRYIIALMITVSFFAGCASAPVSSVSKPQPVMPSVPGFYHRVEKGETLWRISKMHATDLDEIVAINRIADATNIEVGQLIFIPKQKKSPPAAVEPVLEDFIWPVKGKLVSAFGHTMDDVINKGLNIEPYGNSDIVASRSGKVVFLSQNFKGYGKTVIIDHGDGFSTVYARNSQIAVNPGDYVQRGAVIASFNRSGRSRGACYFHFEIRKGHVPQNPAFFLQ